MNSIRCWYGCCQPANGRNEVDNEVKMMKDEVEVRK